jgi:heme A synthase
MPRTGLVRAAWSVVALNLAVILWGAWVRISGSGAGCGSHWPLCDGEVLPRAPSAERLIEFTHRATSGLALLAVVGLAIAVFRALPKGAPARRAAAAAVALILIEAALGAGLVLFELVAEDASPARALVMPLHLVNTLLLLGALTLVALYAGGTRRPDPGAADGLTWAGILVLQALTGASGAVAALGDTLFPSTSLIAAFAADADPASHLLLRLRVAHPAIAVAAALALALAILRTPEAAPGLGWRRLAGALALAQLAIGSANVALLAPASLQLAHLLVADLLWVATVAACAELFARRAPAL